MSSPKSIAALGIGGLLGAAHVTSHLLPYLGIMSDHEESLLHHPMFQIAYMAFIPVSLYMLYRDHRIHKQYEILKIENATLRAEREIAKGLEELVDEKYHI